jgi:hypothetical protein
MLLLFVVVVMNKKNIGTQKRNEGDIAKMKNEKMEERKI